MSLHRYDEKCFFPARNDGQPSYVGAKEGKGYNINVAWNTITDSYSSGVCDLSSHEYRLACEEVLLPVAKEFAPDLILVSCGFDSAIHDQLGGSKLCPVGYYYMTTELLKICSKMVVVLEGGYNTKYLGIHASAVVSALLDLELPKLPSSVRHNRIKAVSDIDPSQAKDWAIEDVQDTKQSLKKYWKCLQGKK